MASTTPATKYAKEDEALAEWVATTYADPLAFVLGAFPWGEPGGPLERYAGPDVWQLEFLEALGAEVAANGFDGLAPVPPVRRAISSGHGIGKSVMVAWLVCWLMSTRPHCRGTLTANTITQLQTKTWASVRTWLRRCLTAHWFVINSERMFHPAFPESWFCALQSSKEENSEAFAGQHAADSTSFYIFDESSAIADKIAEVAEGGLTDGESMIFKFGNPTRNSGDFHKCAFGSGRERWQPVIIDSRTSRFTNHAEIAEWVKEHGEDSDFVRVRVRGLPPSASDAQFIDLAAVTGAQRRPVHLLGTEPLVCGLDVMRGGDDKAVFRFRRGNDARTIPPVKVSGERTRDSMLLVSMAVDILSRRYDGRSVDALFVDATGVGGPVADRLRQMGYRNVWDVQFGGESPERQYANMRAYIWGKGRDWLRAGGCIDADPVLESDLTGPGYHFDKQDRYVLESKESMKKRGLASPDDGDALMCTFAYPVAPVSATPAHEDDEAGSGLVWG